MSEEDRIIHELKSVGQEHIADILQHGSAEDKAQLKQQFITELGGVDFRHLQNVLRDGLQAADESQTVVEIEPPQKDMLFILQNEQRSKNAFLKDLEDVGYKAIHAGKVAFVILAGGSGTRLGIDVPKGLFTCSGLYQKKSLFQIFCEKIRRREKLASAYCGGVPCSPIPLLIMTSAQNDAQTKQFFLANNYFGLLKEQVHFFQQFSLPCYDEATGKILMESSNRICLAPCGNAGVFQALTSVAHGAKESLLQHLQRVGVTHVQISNVDSLLVKVADPLFIGYAIKEKAHVVAKTSRKLFPEECVGVFARINGEWGVIEYSEIGKRATEMDSETGDLKFNCANIGFYVCSLCFLQLASERVRCFTRYHIARKKITTVNGPVIGIKLEAFIFDFFQFAKDCSDSSLDRRYGGFRLMQIQRNDEFAPIKNADGALKDTPAEALQILLILHTRWLTDALMAAATSDNGDDGKKALKALSVVRRKCISAEISPLVSSEGEGLEPHLPRVISQLLEGEPDRIVITHPDEPQLTSLM